MKYIHTKSYIKFAQKLGPVKNRLNQYINNITKGYHESIPLQPIADAIEKEGLQLSDEDGSPWSGFLLGGAECGSEKTRNQVASIDITDTNTNETVAFLHISWCTMPSGKYEIIAYVN